jgi:hypothetical protein
MQTGIVILAKDTGAGRRLRGQPYRFGPIDGQLFLFAQLRAEDHFDFGHSYLLVSFSAIRRFISWNIAQHSPPSPSRSPKARWATLHSGGSWPAIRGLTAAYSQ